MPVWPWHHIGIKVQDLGASTSENTSVAQHTALVERVTLVAADRWKTGWLVVFFQPGQPGRKAP